MKADTPSPTVLSGAAMLDLFFVVPVVVLLLLYFVPSLRRSARETTDTNVTRGCRRCSDLGPQARRARDRQDCVQKINVRRVTNLFLSNVIDYDNRACEPATCKGGIQLDWTNVKRSGSLSSMICEEQQQERTMNEDLVEIIAKLNQRLEAMEERDQREQKERMQISSVIETLQGQLKEGEEKVRSAEQRLKTTQQSMSLQHKMEMEEEQDKVFRFIFELEQRDKHLSYDVVDKIEDDQLRQVASLLVQEYNVRLLAIDCGLNFILDIPKREQFIIEDRKLEIEEVLKKLLPNDLRCAVRFGKPIPMDQNQATDPVTDTQHAKRSRTNTKLYLGPRDTDVKSEDEMARNQKTIDTVPLYDDSVFVEVKEELPELVKPDSSPQKSKEKKDSTRQLSESERKRKRSVLYQEKERPTEPLDSAKDIQIERLTAKVRELEQELKSEKFKHTDKFPVKLRNDDKRMITISLQFYPEKETKQSAFETLLPVDRTKHADIFGRLETLRVSLQGLFLSYSLDEDGNIDDSLAFILQTSIADWQKVKGHEEEIQGVLAELLPEKVCWSHVAAGRFPTSPTKERRSSMPTEQRPMHL